MEHSPQNPPPPTEARYVTFSVQGQCYGAPIEQIRETVKCGPLTKVFLTPSWILGVSNLRGSILLIIDLPNLMNLSSTNYYSSSRIVVLRNDKAHVGILVNGVGPLYTIEKKSIKPPPKTLSKDAIALLSGIASIEESSPIRIIDIPAIFESLADANLEFKKV